MGLFKWLGRCCCPECPICPDRQHRGWTTQPIPGCPPCVDCPPCPDYPTYRGWTATTGFDNRCPKCPACDDDGCSTSRVADEICNCIPTRFLVVVGGLDANCSCFVISTGIPPNHHFESFGNDYNGGRCFTTAAPEKIEPYGSNHWDGTGGGTSCGPPNGLQSDGDFVRMFLTTSFGSRVEINFTIQNHTRTDGYLGYVFKGSYIGTNCEGPWILGNECSECRVVDSPDSPDGNFTDPQCYGAGGTAVVYRCAC